MEKWSAKVGLYLLWMACLFSAGLHAQPGTSQKRIKYFDASNTVVKEIFYIDPKNPNQKTGIYQALFANGNPRIKGAYLNNLADGCWERYYENGTLRSVSQYKAGKLEGPSSTYFENGKLAQTGFYRKDKEDSTWKFYFESGHLKSFGPYKNGFQEGKWHYLHEDSTLKAMAFLSKGRGQYQEFFPGGNIRMEGLIEAGVSDSIWKYFHENGILKAIGHEKNGERQGFWKFYHANGNLSSEGHFKDNKKIGRWKYYHESGDLSSEGDLEGDDKEGVWKFFFPGGGLMGEATFVKGSGDYQEFYDNGKIKMKGRIENNQYEGPWTFYFEDGGLEGECNYFNGYGQYSGYYDNGALKMRGQMHNGQKIGSWDLLGRDGKLIGHYKTFYDMERPIAQKSQPKPAPKDSVKAKPRNTGRPDFLGARQRSRHFVARINELNGFIFAFNPFAVTLSSLPFGVEYYFQDRLGYEVMFTVFRQPFFRDHAEATDIKRVFTLGNSIDFRQKLYSADRGSGNMYIGQEIRISNFSHKLIESETIDSVQVLKNYEGEETKIELSLLVGNRIFQAYNKHKTLTLDLYAGIGFGYRLAKIPDELLIYNRLKTNKLTIPVRLGFNFGFLF